MSSIFSSVKEMSIPEGKVKQIVRKGDGSELWSSGPATLSFTVDSYTFQTEEGMTWREWANSEYNTNGYVVDTSGGIYKYNSYDTNTPYYYIYENGSFARPDNVINADAEHYHISRRIVDVNKVSFRIEDSYYVVDKSTTWQQFIEAGGTDLRIVGTVICMIESDNSVTYYLTWSGTDVSPSSHIIEGVMYTWRTEIHFDIIGITYTAAEGMTWEQWINSSKYNSDDWALHYSSDLGRYIIGTYYNNTASSGRVNAICTSLYSTVYATDVIMAGEEYMTTIKTFTQT